jgi:hypothetical protein
MRWLGQQMALTDMIIRPPRFTKRRAIFLVKKFSG